MTDRQNKKTNRQPPVSYLRQTETQKDSQTETDKQRQVDTLTEKNDMQRNKYRHTRPRKTERQIDTNRETERLNERFRCYKQLKISVP